MKYAEELYIGSGFYGEDRDVEIKNYKEKVVKCREPHECMGCDRGIKAGELQFVRAGSWTESLYPATPAWSALKTGWKRAGG